jgi:predicted Fe-Mo cluster-binding NifX family protein
MEVEMRVAFPSEAPGGLDARLSAHFGHCAAFTLVDVDLTLGPAQGRATDVVVLPNLGHEQGGCLAPVTLLKREGAEALVAGGMGMRPLAGFQSVGIDVYFNEGAETVGEALALLLAGQARRFGPAQACGGGGGGCGGH